MNETPLLREALGSVLRAERRRHGLTLRELGLRARVSLGYISEVERGQKEASSELLASLCDALEVPLARILVLASREVAGVEAITTTSVATGPVVANAA